MHGGSGVFFLAAIAALPSLGGCKAQREETGPAPGAPAVSSGSRSPTAPVAVAGEAVAVDFAPYGLGAAVELPSGASIKRVSRELAHPGGEVAVELGEPAEMKLFIGQPGERECDLEKELLYLRRLQGDVADPPTGEKTASGYKTQMKYTAAGGYWPDLPTPFYSLSTCNIPAKVTCRVFGVGEERREVLERSCLSVGAREAPAAAPGSVAMKLDLNGDGAIDDIAVDSGEVRIGDASLRHVGGAIVRVEVVDIDKSDNRRELAVYDDMNAEEEDNASVSIYAFDGGAIAATRIWTGNAPVIEGDGFVRSVVANCGQTVTVSWKLAGSRLTKAAEETEGSYSEAACAACPYVYVDTGSGWKLAGEILRNLKRRELEGLQSLRLKVAPTGRIALRIAEEKPETSYIDEVFVRVGGVDYRPSSCRERASALCAADKDYAVLGEGETLELVFDLGEAAPASPIELFARGYYLPATAAPR